MGTPFDALLAAAGRAPSGDNTQPWRFVLDERAGTVAFEVDESRDPSPMNAGQRMARVAVGAALENLLRTARHLGWDARPEDAAPPALAAVRLRPGDPGGRVEEVVVERATNRRPYDGRPLPDGLLARLAGETPPLDGVQTHWIAGPGRLAAWADVIGRADALMFGHPAMRRAFLQKVRFDLPEGQSAPEGLPTSSLELSAADRVALRVMRRSPDWLLKLGGAGRVFYAKARQLVESASGLCLVVAPDGTEGADVLVGRAMQRAWLALTGEGLAAQPMMSLLVLENVLDHGGEPLVASLGRDRLRALSAELRRLAPEVGEGRPAFLLRFGFAPPPSGRAERLPLEAVVSAP
jgi:nitroreductase